MNASRSLTFVWTPWSIAASVILIVGTAILCAMAWRRSGYRRSIGVLEMLRLGIVTIGVVMLNGPEWVEEFQPEERPTIAVLWDDSTSMDPRDILPAADSQPKTRREAIAKLVDPASWDDLRRRKNVLIQPFATAQSGHGSDLNDPLARAAERVANLQAVVFVSDGDWNEGRPPVDAASRLRMKNVPIFAVPVGSSTRLPDVELLRVCPIRNPRIPRASVD